jgi:ATP-dependent RNA helicase DeaD
MIVPVQHRGTAERLLASARIKALWAPAPSADSIRARDKENLVREILAMTDAQAEEDLAAGRVLLEQRAPEQLAAVLVRIRREVLPSPEILKDPGTLRKQTRPKTEQRSSLGKNKFSKHPGKKKFAAHPRTERDKKRDRARQKDGKRR